MNLSLHVGKVTSVHTALLWGRVEVRHSTGEAGSSSLHWPSSGPKVGR